MGSPPRGREPGEAVAIRVRRSAFTALRFAEEERFDVSALLRGELRTFGRETLVAGSCLTGTEQPVTEAEWEALAEPSSTEWSDPVAPGEVVDRLARGGLLVTNSDDPELARLREREEQMVAAHWSPKAAAYHFLTRRRDVDLGIDPARLAESALAELGAAEIVASHGPPPDAFDTGGGEPSTPLPLDGPAFEALRRRRTTRSFDGARELTLEDFSTLLRWTFGAHGYERVGELVTLSKTSPSGGGMHAIEAYPLVTRVAGLAPGLYHYDVRSHGLAPVEELETAAARALADEFTCGQSWFRDAHALVLLVARFSRMFWKYRDDDRAYGVLLMDAGHLSQTLYLVATELGLGAFVTAFVNDRNIEERLGLDGISEGVLAVCGCGVPAADRGPLAADVLPYVPRETTI